MTVYERTAPRPLFDVLPPRPPSPPRVPIAAEPLDYATAPALPPPAPARPGDLSRRAALLILLLLTLAGGGLRFLSLDRPDIWGDEASTFRRTCGTYGQLLDNLQDDGFVPLHYELYWWINQGMPLWPKAVTNHGKTTYDSALRLANGRVKMTPVVMRLVPAVAGTLMLPALYFLAAQLFDRRRALLATLLAAGSAWLLVYSRDAKMYMPFWLFATLHLGCLLAWIRTGGQTRRLYWWAWVATGAAAVGFHALGLMVPAVELLIVLSVPNRGWRRAGGGVARALYAPLLPVQVAASALVRWTDGADDADWWAERGAVGRWAQRPRPPGRWPPLALFVIGLPILLAGLLTPAFLSPPLPPYGYYTNFNRYAEKIYGDEGENLADPNFRRASDLNWITEYNDGRTGGDLLLYTASAYLTGWEWPRAVDQPKIPERTRKAMKGATVALLALLILGLFPWRNAGRRLRRRFADPADAAAPDPPPRWRRGLWIGAWVAVPMYAFYCMSVQSFYSPLYWLLAATLDEPPALAAAPAIPLPAWAGGKPSAAATPSWWDRAADVWHQNRAAIWDAATADNVRFFFLAALLAAAVLGLFLCARTWAGRVRAAATLAAAVLIVFSLCLPVYLGLLSFRPTGGTSVWMPRYLGFVWPAVIIAVAVLIARLPTRPLRWAAVALFLAVNLAQFGNRVYAGSEPPTGRIAADLIAARPPDDRQKPDVLTFVRLLYPNYGAPGTGVLNSQPMRYSFTLAGHLTPGVDYTPEDVKHWSRLDARFFPPAAGQLPYDRFVSVVARRANNPGAPEKLIVWEGIPPGRGADDNPILAALGPQWTMVDQQLYPVRDHWTWIDLFTARRRVYLNGNE